MSEQLWGGETVKAVENFPVSGDRVPVSVIRWLGRLKAAAARYSPDNQPPPAVFLQACREGFDAGHARG